MSKQLIDLELQNGSLYNIATKELVDNSIITKNSDKFEYRVLNVSDQMATGVAIQKYDTTSTDFLLDIKDYKFGGDIYKEIELSNLMYRYEDTVSTGLDILIDFTISPMAIENVEDEDLKEILNFWKDHINHKSMFDSAEFFDEYGIMPLAEMIATEWFISGNVFPWEVWKNVPINEKVRSLPVMIKLLNPRVISIDEISASFGNPEYVYNPGLVSSKLTLDKLFQEVNRRKVSTELFGNVNIKGSKTAGIPLDRQFLSHIKRRARHYEVWGRPYLSKLIGAVAYKQKLIRLDLQTIEGLINMITIFKLGSPDKDSPYHRVPKTRIDSFAALIKNPNASSYLAWDHAIDVITTGPDGKILDFSKKYEEANIKIIRGLGIPQVLIDGAGNAQTSWIAIKALVERLEKVQNSIKVYFEHILHKIAANNGFENVFPKVRFAPTNLQDDRTIKNLLLSFYDRGLLPIKVMHEQLRTDHEEMIRLKELEEKDGLQELFKKPLIPFDSPQNNQFPGDSGRPTDKTKSKNPSKAFFDFNLDDKEIKSKLKEKYKEDVLIVLEDLENKVVALDRRDKTKIELYASSEFIRMEQLSRIFTDFEGDFIDFELNSKLGNWVSSHLDNLRNYIVGNINKIAKRKEPEEEKVLFIRGVFSEARKRLNMFIDESVKNIDLVKEISNKKKDGFVGAIFHADENTQCQLCREASGNFMTHSELFDSLPFHPHERFNLEFLTENPVIMGKMKNKIIRQSKKNKSKML